MRTTARTGNCEHHDCASCMLASTRRKPARNNRMSTCEDGDHGLARLLVRQRDVDPLLEATEKGAAGGLERERQAPVKFVPLSSWQACLRRLLSSWSHQWLHMYVLVLSTGVHSTDPCVRLSSWSRIPSDVPSAPSESMGWRTRTAYRVSTQQPESQ